MPDLAHLGPFEIEARESASTYLRGPHDYQRRSRKLTACETIGMGVLGLRASVPSALERRVAAVEAPGLGIGWTDGDLGRGPSYGIEPGGNRIEVTTGGRFVYDPEEP